MHILRVVIRSFKSKGLRSLWETGKSAKIAAAIQSRALKRLDALDGAISLSSLDQPGFDFHAPHTKPQRYTLHVNGPWCITFEWDGADAFRVDLEQYH